MRAALFTLRPEAEPWPEQGHRFAADMVLDTCLVDASSAARYRFTLAGEDTAYDLIVPGLGRLHRRIGLPVPAGAALGLRAIGPGVQGSVTCELQTAANRVVRAGVMEVRWVHRQEQLILWRYTESTRIFTPIQESWLGGRAEIESNETLARIAVQGREIVSVGGGVVGVSVPIIAGGVLSVSEPRIEFWTMGHRVATVGPTSFAVPSLQHPEVSTPSAGDFVFPGGSSEPALVMGVNGCQVGLWGQTS